MTKSVATKNTAAANAPVHGEEPNHKLLTAELTETRMRDAIGSIVGAFTQVEQRIVADNGKRYPVDASLPAGVEDTGEIAFVNIYEFLAGQVAGAVCWKLETLLDNQDQRIEQQKVRVRDMDRGYQNGRVDETLLNRGCDILEAMIDQRALVVAAFKSALDAYEAEMGHAFETAAERKARARLNEAKPTAGASSRAKALLK